MDDNKVSRDRWVIVFFDGDANDEVHQVTSPIALREMCERLIKDGFDVYSSPAKVRNRVMFEAKMNHMVLGDGSDKALHDMAWGEWLEVAKVKKGEMRLYVVKVADDDITETDLKPIKRGV